MTVTIDSTGMAQAVRDYFSEVIDRATENMLADTEANAPRDTGAMTQTVEISERDSDTRLERLILFPQEYSSYVDEGTRPHRIEGNPFLAFTLADGTRVVVRSVQHPGTARTGWFTDIFSKFADYLAAAR